MSSRPIATGTLAPYLDDLTRAVAALTYQAQNALAALDEPTRDRYRATADRLTALADTIRTQNDAPPATTYRRVVALSVTEKGHVYVATDDGLVWRQALLDYQTRRWDGTESRHVWAALEAGRVPGCGL